MLRAAVSKRLPASAVNSGRPLSARFILSDVPSERNLRMPSRNSGRQVARVHQLQKCPARVQIAGDDGGAEFPRHSSSTTPLDAAAADEDLLDRSAGADGRALAAGRIGDGVRNRAHAAAHESPQSAMAVDAAHAVMQQNIGRAGRSRAAVGSDHAVGGEGHLELFGFEPSSRKSAALCVKIFTRPTISARGQPAHASEQFQVIDEIAGSARRKIRAAWSAAAIRRPRRAARGALRIWDTPRRRAAENLAISARVLARSCHMNR